jgi:hypothetical protein
LADAQLARIDHAVGCHEFAVGNLETAGDGIKIVAAAQRIFADWRWRGEEL